MVNKYPPTINDLKGSREKVPRSEIKFYEILDALGDDWYMWHSVNWDRSTREGSGEVDFLLFHPELGFVVIEVKGGIISVDRGRFYSTDASRNKTYPIHDPFTQARRSMFHILEVYQERALIQSNPSKLLKEGKIFPLNFAFGVFFPDCQFKQGFETLQYSFDMIFDEDDLIRQIEWKRDGEQGKSPLELFLRNLLNKYIRLRVPRPKVAKFFPKLIGSNISRDISLKKYFEIREHELEQVNQLQDYLINSLSEKKRCIFKGSAGSGKTYIAMKKALDNNAKNKTTLFLCFNSELRDSIKIYVSEKLGKPYEQIKNSIDVYSLHSFLSKLIGTMFDKKIKGKLYSLMSSFSYDQIAEQIKKQMDHISPNFKYDSILIDEAQDMDPSLWDVFSAFLRDQVDSTFYVFYDDEQALFVKDFSPEAFGMDAQNDLIVLKRNLRNSVEIANWLKLKTKLGTYDEFSGINGFKISTREFDSPSAALKRALLIIHQKYYTQGILTKQVAILSYYKLNTLIPDTHTSGKFDTLRFKDKKSRKEFCLIEPKRIEELEMLKSESDTIHKDCILFKTITSFKGLEKNILFLLMPKLEEFKKVHPDRLDNLIMQLYVGASRAKFKLYFYEYKLPEHLSG